jgi:molybdopterin adenylyltransferase
MPERSFQPLKIAILTVSDTRTLETDGSGELLQERLLAAGHHKPLRALVADNLYEIRAILSNWIAQSDIDVIITTGGTGVTGRDGTPEAARVLFDKTLEGFGELFRIRSHEEIGSSTMQSRAIAGVANGTYIFCLPGSSGACRLGWDDIIGPQLDLRTRPCNLVELMPRLKER